MVKTKLNSERIKIDNPMFNKETRDKVSVTLKKKYSSGKIIHPMLGKKRPDVIERNLKNNPMKNLENVKKVSKRLKEGYDNGRINNVFKGVKGRIWESGHPKGMLNKHHTEETKDKIRKNISGERNPFFGKKHSKELREQISKKVSSTLRKKFENEEIKEKFVKKMLDSQHKRPTEPERIMIEIIKENKLPFNYVGNGQVWIGGFNPDFLSKNPRHIIEINGDYWHNLPNVKEKDKRKLETYQKYGYKVLTIWESELRNPTQVIEKINKFMGVN